MGWGGVGRGPATESEGRRDGKVVPGPFTGFKMGSVSTEKGSRHIAADR